MNFIKKIFQDAVDGETHHQFKKYSKGIFEDKALVEIKKGKQGVTVKTSAEFANEFVVFLAGKSSGSIHVTGSIITSKDLRGELGIDIKDYKQFMGVKNISIDADLEGKKLVDLIKQFPDALFLLSFSNEYGSLKCKTKAPKSGKSSTKEKEPKADFCTFTTSDKDFIKEFAFDIDEHFSRAFIKHVYIIHELVVPEQYKNDFEKARVLAQRKGKIKRIIDLDGRLIEREKDLLV